MQQQFIRNEMFWGEEGQTRLASTHVILFGLGGVGSYCAEALTRSGIGELTIVDAGTVTTSNLNRQLEALHSTIAQRKTDAVAARLLDINPTLQLHAMYGTYDASSREKFFPIGCHYDYVADAIDLVSCKLDLIETALRLHFPILSALGTGNKLDLTQLQITDLSKTSGCPLARVMRKELRNRNIYHLPVVFSPEPPAPVTQLEAPPPGRRSVPASNAWVPATAGLLMASHIVQTLIKQGNELC